jgi:hypothetical protein
MDDDAVDYETVETELQRLVDDLYDADPATIQAQTTRLRRLAERIDDDTWRHRAIRRAEQLPSLVAGPPAGTSEQYRRAEQLLGEAMGGQGPVDARIARVEQITRAIWELAQQAPAQEAGAIMRMNNSLARLIEDLRRAAG